jgi:hypothetical protein
MHDAVERVEGSKQGGGAVPLIVVRHCSAFAGLERQPRLGAIKRLDLRLLIDREHHRTGRWMHVEADDILHLLGQCRVGGAFEGAEAMRLQAVGAPDALHPMQRQADHFGHRATGPMGHLAGRFAAGQRQHPVDGLDRHRLFARRPVLSRSRPATPASA